MGTGNHFKLKIPEILSILGDGSYSVYLVYGSVRVLIFVLARKLAPADFALNDFHLYIIAIFSLVAGMGVWFLIEKPILKYSRRFVRNACS